MDCKHSKPYNHHFLPTVCVPLLRCGMLYCASCTSHAAQLPPGVQAGYMPETDQPVRRGAAVKASRMCDGCFHYTTAWAAFERGDGRLLREGSIFTKFPHGFSRIKVRYYY